MIVERRERRWRSQKKSINRENRKKDRKKKTKWKYKEKGIDIQTDRDKRYTERN